MMTIFYSGETCGFYRDDIHTQMPEDVVSVTQEQYDELFEKQSQGGFSIVPDATGNPIAMVRVAVLDSLPVQAKRAIDDSNDIIMEFAENSIPVPSEWANYRKQLRQVLAGTLTIMPTQPA